MAISNLSANSKVAEYRTLIGTNSATIASGEFVGIASGFATKLGATGPIEGIALQTVTFASDNQTVAKATVQVLLPRKGITFVAPCTSASLSQANVGNFFVLDSSQNVDYSTASTAPAIVNTSDAGAAADPVIGRQVKLVKYVGQNTSVYEFVTIG